MPGNLVLACNFCCCLFVDQRVYLVANDTGYSRTRYQENKRMEVNKSGVGEKKPLSCSLAGMPFDLCVETQHPRANPFPAADTSSVVRM